MFEANMKVSVSGLVNLLREVVESNFVDVLVEGEISNFSAPASGHWYFSLKDDRAQLRAVMFRGRNRLVDVLPKDGQQVVCQGSVGIYTARGEMQLVVDSLTAGGVGDLQQAFEAMKLKLASEGLFAIERKRSLPPFPACIGVVTSATGAAIHDILNVIRRRAPGLRILLRPVRVQGDGAALEIAEAIQEFNQFGTADVLIVGRGGGSLEDLWAFNEEVLARAIVASQIPVISAVGHEVDVTIADLAADARAATPSAAAEMVAKSRLELETHLDHLIMRLQSQLGQRVAMVGQRLEGLEGRLRQSMKNWISRKDLLDHLVQRLVIAMRGELRRHSDCLARLVGQLQALSPLDQLARGYVIASREKDGNVLQRADELTADDEFWLRFADGLVKAKALEVKS